MSTCTEIAAPPKRRRLQSPSGHAQRNAAPHALLTSSRCAIDLPVISGSIPQQITFKADTAGWAFITDAMLNLATAACDTPSTTLLEDANLAHNIVQAADTSLRNALRCVRNSVSWRWWGSAHAAMEGTQPYEGCETDGGSDRLHEQYPGAKAVLEFFPIEGGDVDLASNAVDSSTRLQAYEGVCPGFTHLLYTCMELVNQHIWPVITPRSLWDDQSYSDSWWGLQSPCDSEIARNVLMEYCDMDDLASRYGVSDITQSPPPEVIQIYQEEIGGVLPSDFLEAFGPAAIGAWNMAEDSPCRIYTDPKYTLAPDLCVAMNSMQARMPWCPTAPAVLHQLERMHRIVREIENGARLAGGANNFGSPSNSAFQIHRCGDAREKRAFYRLLDEAAQGAQECGETLDTAGWFCKDMSTLEKTRTALDVLQRGAAVLHNTTELLLDLFYQEQP